jgi:phosphatidylglycerophosphate synthase
MIKRAYLVGSRGANSDLEIAGLSVLLRQVLSLQDAGVEEVILVGVLPDHIADDPRLRVRVQSQPSGPDREAIVATAGCVWHPAVVRRLARVAIDPERVVAVASAEAAIYACGSRRVAAVLATLGSGPNSPLRIDKLDPAPGEFIVFPSLPRRSRKAKAGTAADRTKATTLLLRSLEKPTDGLVSRHLHRPLSRAVTERLLRWPVTPNMMTLFAAAFGIAGVAVAWRGGYLNILIGAMLFEVQNVLDGCDGEIARLKYLRSRAGEWLDQVIDDVLNIAFLSAVGVALSRDAGPWAWRLTVICIAAQLIHVIGLYSGLILKAGGRGSVAMLRWWVGGAGNGGSSRMLGDLTRRDFVSFAYVVSALLNLAVVAFIWHALITVGSAIVSTLQWIAWNGPDVYAEADGMTDPTGA